MDRYMDFRILPDPEFPTSQLMNALFAKLHRCLAKLDARDLGISFPEVNQSKPSLGAVLRLHGSERAISKLVAEAWLTGMRDHLRIGEVRPVPDATKHRRVRRVQAKSSAERIRRRQMKRHGWSEEEARQRIPDSIERTLSLPFLMVESGSTGRRFRLFVEHIDVDAPATGTFNAYGLSSTGTVPWF